MPNVDEIDVGFQDLLDRLGDVESLVAQKLAIARSLKAGGELIRDRAQELAPLLKEDEEGGNQAKRGQLKESMIVTITDQTATEAIAKIGPSRKGFFGFIPEFGLANNPAQPFLRPAWDEKVDEAVAVIGYTLGNEIEKAFLKQLRK